VLTADLVHTTRRGDRLYVTKLRGARLERAQDLAAAMVDAVRLNADLSRGTLTEQLHGLEGSPRDRKLARGLARILLQRCAFEVAAEVEPVKLRQELFTAAAQARQRGTFDRQALLAAAGAQHGLEPAAVDVSLFADLKHTHRLVSFKKLSGPELVAQYELAQTQAVLLRATSVTATVRAADVQTYRRLFGWLKFLRLLWRCERRDDSFELVIDGPFALFAQSTRYGLALAMVLPVLREMDHFELVADVQWGRARLPLRFATEGKRTVEPAALRLTDEVQRLHDDINALDGDWTCVAANEIIDVPGHGVLVPDLVVRRSKGVRVLVEILGFWSRPAVWRRVEMAQTGLAVPTVFVLSSRLRVSEEVLDADLPAALYVYKGVISAREVIRKVEQAVKAGAT
jgi:uncharacterized protein